VALIWRDKLKDARETADAWRRVLRMKPGDSEAKEGVTLAKRAMPYRRSPATTGPRRRPGAQGSPSGVAPSQMLDRGGLPAAGGFELDDDEEVREEDLSLDDDVDGVFDAASGADGRGQGEDLDVDIELEEDEDDDEADPVTTVDERSVLNYAEAAGPGLRLRPPGMSPSPSGSQPSKRKRPRKRARTVADTGVHRKPNVSRRSKKH
jgi:hypothetical protein